MYKIKIWAKPREAIDFNAIDALRLLNNTAEILKDINNNNVNKNNLMKSSIKFAWKLGIDSDNNFNRVHWRTLVPKRLDSNSNLQMTFEMKTLDFRIESPL